MAHDPLGALFDRYRREGDLAALARVVETVAPELLRLARYLRPRGQTPEDLVQATFLAALTHQERYDSRLQIRPWLFGILLNKATTDRRSELALEAEVLDHDTPESGAEEAESARILARGLERLPPIYSDVLRDHFFAGLSPQEIAARHGRPPGTVRAQLHRGLRLLRVFLPAGMASQLIWLGPARASLLRVRRNVLDQAAAESASVSAQPGLPPFAGAQMLGTCVVALAAGLGLRQWLAEPQSEIAPPSLSQSSTGDPTHSLPAARTPRVRTGDELDASAAIEPSEVATHGDLIVRVLFHDGSPAPEVGVRVHVWSEPSWHDNRIDGVTNANGEFALANLLAGKVGIYCDRGGDEGFGGRVTAGEETLREITLPRGLDIEGDVVDARGSPVAHAGIWLSESPSPTFGRIALTCDEHGRFTLRDVTAHRFVGARAPGFAPSSLEWLGSGDLRNGSSAQIRIILPDGGGLLAGTVVDALGAPVSSANVVIRAMGTQSVRLREDGALLSAAAPITVITNALGRFEVADLALDEYKLVAQAIGQPEQVATTQLSLEKPFDDIELRLPAGGRLIGTVRLPNGEPALGAVVISFSGTNSFADLQVDENGAFVLEGLTPGTVEVQAGFGHGGGGELARTSLWLNPGGELEWDAIVETPQSYSGRVTGPNGEPIAGAWLRAVSTERNQDNSALPHATDELAAWLLSRHDHVTRKHLEQVAADAEGRFELQGVPQPFVVEVRLPDGRAGWPIQVFDRPPTNGELALSSTTRHVASLSGVLADRDGQALARGEVFVVLRQGGSLRTRVDTKGAFRFESLPTGTFDVLVWTRGSLPRIVAEVKLTEGEERELGWLQIAH